MRYYVLLLPYKLGVFTSADELLPLLNEGSLEDYKTVYDWKEIVHLIRNRYSNECLFLMGIENFSILPKNVCYEVPLEYRGAFIESDIQKREVMQ